LLAASVAAADPTAAELDAKGEQLAKDGHYSEAIDQFKAANRLAPNAHDSCLIALAYTRRELWPQAEIHLEACRVHATAADPLPDWFDGVVQLLNERLAAVAVAPITIVVEPRGARVQLAVSSFAPDEQFAPRTIHLPLGHHVISATAPGYEREQVPIDVADRSARDVVIRLREISPPYRTTSRRLIIGGAIAIAAGGLSYGVMSYAWEKLDAAYPDHATEYARYHGTYTAARVATVGLWSVGAALAITGYVIHRRFDTLPEVATMPLPGGAMFALAWHR
jgi:hypothetical protein